MARGDLWNSGIPLARLGAVGRDFQSRLGRTERAEATGKVVKNSSVVKGFTGVKDAGKKGKWERLVALGVFPEPPE